MESSLFGADKALADPALIELAEEGDPDEEVAVLLRTDDTSALPEEVRVVVSFGPVLSCRIRRGDLASVHAHPAVTSLKAPRLMFTDEIEIPEAERLDLTIRSSDLRRPEGITAKGRGCVIGIVDWGLDFTLADFRKPDGSTRLLALWDQTGATRGAGNKYGYGTIHARASIDQALRTRTPFVTLAYHPAVADTGQGAHGTLVAAVAAGSGASGAPPGLAPEAELVFVHLASSRPGSVRGPRSPFIGDYVTLMEAIDFIMTTAGDRPLVINLSMGQHTGQHDGTTLVERGLDSALMMRDNFAIVQSGGNYWDRPIHVSGQLRPGESRTMRLLTDRADTTPNEVDFWYAGRDRMLIELVAPAGVGRWQTELGQRVELRIGGQDCGTLYHRAHDPNNGDHNVDIFLYPAAPAGTWDLTVTGIDVPDGRYHGWVQRDATCRGCQALFHVEDADSWSTTGTICNGLRTIAVGAYNGHEPDRPIARFSSAGPTRDGRIKPDLIAPGVEIIGARSTPRTGEATPLTRQSGTSFAAPFVSGLIALMLEVAPTPLAIHEIRSRLLHSAHPLDPSERMRSGSGYVDVERALLAASAPKAGTAVAPARKTEAVDVEVPPMPIGQEGASESEAASERVTVTAAMAQGSESETPEEETVMAASERSREKVERSVSEDRDCGCGRSSTMRLRPGEAVARYAPTVVIDRDPLQSMLLPLALIMATRQTGRLPEPTNEWYELVGIPGRRLTDALREGDLVITAASADGEVLRAAGPAASTARGVRVGVTGAGRRAGFLGERVRMVTDAAGRVLPDRAILRSRARAYPGEGVGLDEARQFDHALPANRIYSGQLGWRHDDPRLLQLLGLATNASPDEYEFAAAVARFQSSAGLTSDGILGPQTWALLSSRLGGAGAPIQPHPTAARFAAQLPRAGQGFYAYGAADHQFGLAMTMRAIGAIAARWSERHPRPRLGIGDISLASGASFGGHVSHRAGIDVDIRPVRSDGRELPVRWYKEECDSSRCAEGVDPRCVVPEYSEELTQELVEIIRDNGVLPVQYIFFNDCRVHGVSRWPAHDDHLHIRFIAPAGAEAEAEPSEVGGALSPTRTCCMLAPNVPPFGGSNFVDPLALGTHGSSSEAVGLVYSSAAGFVDLGHLRDLVDLTKYVYDQIALSAGAVGTVVTKHGDATILRTIPPAEWVNCARAIAFDDSFAYEILTYDAIYPGGHNSSFSPEDLPSNYLGTLVAARAIAAGGPFSAAATSQLTALLASLGALSTADSAAAFALINGRWVSYSGVLSLGSYDYLKRRNFTSTPWHAGHPSDTATPAWVTAPLLTAAAFYDYRHTAGHAIPKVTWPTELARIRADAASRYGAAFDRP